MNPENKHSESVRNENNDGQKNKKAQKCNGCRIVCHNDRDKVKRFFFSKRNNPYESLPITLPELPWREKVLSHINRHCTKRASRMIMNY